MKKGTLEFMVLFFIWVIVIQILKVINHYDPICFVISTVVAIIIHAIREYVSGDDK